MSLTIDDLNNAKLDVETIEQVSMVGTSSDSIVNREGTSIDTLQGRLKKLGYLPPVSYAAQINFSVSDNVKTIERNGIIYAPKPSSLPFSTSGSWLNDDQLKFFVIQTTGQAEGIEDLQTLSGVPANSENLGSFSGNIIPDDRNNKQALQSLESAIESFDSQEIVSFQNVQIFNSSDTFTVPAGVTKISVIAVGSGGGGGGGVSVGSGSFDEKVQGGGSGGSGAIVTFDANVSPNENISFIVGEASQLVAQAGSNSQSSPAIAENGNAGTDTEILGIVAGKAFGGGRSPFRLTGSEGLFYGRGGSEGLCSINSNANIQSGKLTNLKFYSGKVGADSIIFDADGNRYGPDNKAIANSGQDIKSNFGIYNGTNINHDYGAGGKGGSVGDENEITTSGQIGSDGVIAFYWKTP